MLFSFVALATLACSAAAQNDPYEQFLNGLLGSIAPSVNASVKPCLVASDSGYSDTRKAFLAIEAGLQAGNFTKIYQGITYFISALSDLRNAAARCGEAKLAAELDALIVEIGTDPTKVILKLLPNLLTVLSDLESAVADWNAKDYTGAGTQIGNVIVIILSAGTLVRVPTRTTPALLISAKFNAIRRARAVRADPPVPPPSQLSGYVLFLNGILSELAPTVNGSVAPCLHDSDAGLIAVTRGISLIQSGIATGNFTAIYQGITFFTTALSDITAAARACNEPVLATEIEGLIKLILTDPLGVLDRLLPHLPTVLADLTAAVTDFLGGNYYDAGQNVGHVLVYLLTPVMSGAPFKLPPLMGAKLRLPVFAFAHRIRA